VRWITDPIVASLLITLGLFLIVADAFFAGFGVAAVAGLLCLGLFFWGHLLAGFAGWEDLLLIGLGLLLLGIEIFVIPGFGFAGISGIVALAAGLVLSMSGRSVTDFQVTGDLVRAGWVVAISLGLVVAALVGISLLTPGGIGIGTFGGRRLGGLSLAATVDTDDERITEGRRPGWLVRQFGGQDVLERGNVHMPGASGTGSAPGSRRRRD
jgi:hypothetical protein